MTSASSNYNVSPEQIANEADEIKRAQHNPARFDVLYNRYYEPILKFIYKRVDTKDLAFDLTQQTFCKAMANLHKYTPQGVPFSAWLYRIAMNELNLLFRSNKAQQALNVNVDEITNVLHEINTEGEEKYEPLLAALTALAPDDLLLIEMRFFEKRAFKEIGEILDITEINAKTKTYRVIEKLKQLITKK
ncbi:MAG: sigma-70 family RNA polymerase sigma factor [Bacteroidia bacterium]